MSTKEILIRARERISTPERWCKSAYSEDANGTGLGMFQQETACKWCLFGAVSSVAEEMKLDYSSAWHVLGRQVEKINPHIGLITYNDRPETTHADVLSLLDQGIASV